MAIVGTLTILPMIAIAVLNIVMTRPGSPRLSQVVENYMGRYPVIAAVLAGFFGALAGHIFWAIGPNPAKDFGELKLVPIAFGLAIAVGVFGAAVLALLGTVLRPLTCPSREAILASPGGSPDVNETKTIRVRAHCFWNDSGLDVRKGERYSVTASGSWWDLNFRSGAAGYSAPSWSVFQNLLQGHRRMPGDKWFALGGQVLTVDRTTAPIEVGENIFVPSDGRLTFFANDVPGFYWNNWGALTLQIRRVS